MQHSRESWKDSLAGDVRFALRYFARHKAAVAIIVVVLALGTGANTLIFSIIQSELIRPARAAPRVARSVWSGGMSQGLIIAPGVNVWAIGAVIALILLAVAAAATWVPAQRAARVDPSTTLRVE